MRIFLATLFMLIVSASMAFAFGSLPLDVNGKPMTGGALSGIGSVTPGTKGTASVSTTGKNGLYYTCTTSPTGTTAAIVKVGRNGSTASFYPAASGAVNIGSGTGTTSVTFTSYSSANNNTCFYYYW